MKKEKKARILLIDDEELFRKHFRLMFKKSRYVIAAHSGSGDVNKVVEIIDKFKPHILIQGLNLVEFSGIEILRKLRDRKDFRKIVLSSHGSAYYAEEAKKLGADFCVSKPVRFDALVNNPYGGIKKQLELLAKYKKNKLIRRLIELVDVKPLPEVWRNISDVKKSGSGSEVIYTKFYGFKQVRVIGLYLTYTEPRHGSCISIGYGCNKSCRICKSGTKEKFQGYFDHGHIVAQEELILRRSHYYDRDFWLHGLPFFVAIMGAGEIAFNFKETMKAMEIIHTVFEDRFTCNISTAFITGVDQLLRYVESGKNKVVPNLQISVHGTTVAVRSMHVDSREEPQELVKKSLEYARQTNTILTVNYGLTTINSSKQELRTVLGWLNPEISRIKFALMNLSKLSGLTVVGRKEFNQAACLAKEIGIKFEIFNERRQMGLENGAACGTVVNRII